MRKTTKIDLHLHTRGSDGISSATEIASAAAAAGLDGICITDHHNTVTKEGAEVAQAVRALGLMVFRGCEFSTDDGHLLVYGIDVADLRLGRYPAMQLVIDRAVEAGGVCVPSHPYKGYKRRLEDKVMKLKRVPAYEVENGQCATRDPRINKLAWCAAKLTERSMTGGSDAHVATDIGLTYTLFDQRITTEREFLHALRYGTYRPVVARKRIEEREAVRLTALRQRMALPGWLEDDDAVF